jgi:hypothetical protein
MVPVDLNQWSRSAGWVEVNNGDFLEKTDDGFLVRWSGLTLFHVKPPTIDDLRPNAISSDQRELTPGWQSIQEAIAKAWEDGIPKGLSVKQRDDAIRLWQKQNGRVVTSERTIRRYLAAMGTS